MSTTARPLFITFEGLDGSGKTSHLKAVSRRLASAQVAHCLAREPGGTELGSAIRELFLDSRWGQLDGEVELLLLFASRRQLLTEVIEPALKAGSHVLCDRFTDSTFAYQGSGRGVNRATILEIDRLATGCARPDRTLLFDLPAEIARRRRQSAAAKGSVGDRFDEQRLGFYRKVRQAYLELADQEPNRIVVIDSSGAREQTQRQVLGALSDLFELTSEPSRMPTAERAER